MFALTGEAADQVVWGHVVLRVGHHAKATVVFEHTGSARYAHVTSVFVADSAQLDLVSLQLWDDGAVHTGQVSARLGRDARLRSFQASLGGDLVRLVETAEYDGPGGEVEMHGLYFVSGDRDNGTGREQHIEHRLFVDHNAPATRSRVALAPAPFWRSPVDPLCCPIAATSPCAGFRGPFRTTARKPAISSGCSRVSPCHWRPLAPSPTAPALAIRRSPRSAATISSASRSPGGFKPANWGRRRVPPAS